MTSKSHGDKGVRLIRPLMVEPQPNPQEDGDLWLWQNELESASAVYPSLEAAIAAHPGSWMCMLGIYSARTEDSAQTIYAIKYGEEF